MPSFVLPSPAGTLVGTVDDAGALTRLTFALDPATPAQGLGTPAASALARWVDDWQRGLVRPLPLPVAPAGTPFDRAVRDELLRIPLGVTRTYGDVARRMGRPGAARAVGGACGRNPIVLLVPCHRVVAADGPGGFSGPPDRKRHLLRVEADHAPLPLFDAPPSPAASRISPQRREESHG